MEFPKMELENLTLYTSGICNLKCGYCFIHKNPALTILHKKFMDSYENPNYYLNFLDKLKNIYDLNNLFSITLWGVEPSYGFRNASETLKLLMKKYPKINRLNTSTNFTRDTVVDDLLYMLKYLKDSQEYIFSLQISIDGPEQFTDLGRGIGTTKKILDNLHILISRLNELPKNVKLQISAKSTLSADEFPMLNDEKSLYDFFNFFETKFWNPISKTNIGMQLHRTTPALPYQYTTEDGKIFNELLKKCITLANNNPFKYETPFLDRITIRKAQEFTPKCTYKCYGLFCGAGVKNIGLLPDYKVCSCQREFIAAAPEYYDYSDSYKPDTVDPSIFGDFKRRNIFCLDYKDHERLIYSYLNFHGSNATSIISSTTALVMILAQVGQVLEKYKDKKEATLISQKFIRLVGNCYVDSYSVTGTLSEEYMGCLKLYLNGFLETIDSAKEIILP